MSWESEKKTFFFGIFYLKFIFCRFETHTIVRNIQKLEIRLDVISEVFFQELILQDVRHTSELNQIFLTLIVGRQ